MQKRLLMSSMALRKLKLNATKEKMANRKIILFTETMNIPV